MATRTTTKKPAGPHTSTSSEADGAASDTKRTEIGRAHV